VLLAGLAWLVRHPRRPGAPLLALWLAIGPIPGAITQDTPHAVRSIVMLPALHLVSAAGAVSLWRWLKPHWARTLWIALLVSSIAFYLYTYYRYYSYERAGWWQSGALETFRTAQALVDGGDYKTVVLPSDVGGGLYVFALFATQYDPARYLAQGGTKTDLRWPRFPEPGPFRFDPFEVRVVDWDREARQPLTLYLWHGDLDPPAGTRIVRVIRNIRGDPALRMIDRP
jgi:hypothetical protein